MSNLKNMTLQKREWMLPLLSSVGFMVLCHGFMLMNPGYSHDGLNEVVRDMGEYQTTLGRFLQVPWKSLFGGITATWFLGLVTATAIGFAAFFLASVLEIKRPVSVILICGILITNYTFICSIATYAPWIDTYGGALLLAMLAVWMTKKQKYGVIPAVPCAAATLALYPPYIMCIPSLALIWLVRSLLKDDTWKERLLFLLRLILMLAAAYTLYRISHSLILKQGGLNYATDENSITNIKLFGFDNLALLVKETYLTFFDWLINTMRYMPLHRLVIAAVGAVLLLAVGIELWHRRKSLWNMLLLSALLILSPLVFNSQYIVCESATYHALMVYSVYFAYILIIAVDDLCMEQNNGVAEKDGMCTAKKKWEQFYRYCVPVVIAFVLFCNVRYANNVYTGKYLREKTTISVMTRVMTRAEETKGYDPESMPIVIMGSLDENPVLAIPSDAYYPILGNPKRFFSITYNYNAFLKNYMGYAMVGTDAASREAIRDSITYQQMPAFPESGFAGIINGCLVVKLSE